jgi:glycosyltransferase involved in cell wall biosynthesis
MTANQRQEAPISTRTPQPTVSRLLIITEQLPNSPEDFRGAWIPEFVAALRQRGVESELLTGGEPNTMTWTDEALVAHSLHRPDFDLSGKSPSGMASYFKIKDCLQSCRQTLIEHLAHHAYDHILAIGAFPAGWVARMATEGMQIPYSIWSHGSDINLWSRKLLYGKMVRPALRYATALFAEGDELANKIHQISGRECQFLPVLRRFHHRILPMPRENFFLYVGALEKHKGIFDLLKAFARIKKDIWDYRLLIIGSGSQEERLQKSITSMKLRGKVHAIGTVTNEELVNYLQRARALVIPSQIDSLPLVFGEAVQTSTPLVVTDVGDLGTLVRDNRLGFVARRKSPAKLADAMVRMIVGDLDVRSSSRHLVERLNSDNAAGILLETLAEKK